MKANQLAQIGVRLVALYLIAQGITSLPNLYFYFPGMQHAESFSSFIYAVAFISILSPVVIGVLLWVIAPLVSNSLTSPFQGAELNNTFNDNQLQTSAIFLIGIYLLTISIPDLVAAIYQYSKLAELESLRDSAKTSIQASLLTATIELVLGVLLVVGANAITRWVSRLRNLGLNK